MGTATKVHDKPSLKTKLLNSGVLHLKATSDSTRAWQTLWTSERRQTVRLMCYNINRVRTFDLNPWNQSETYLTFLSADEGAIFRSATRQATKHYGGTEICMLVCQQTDPLLHGAAQKAVSSTPQRSRATEC